MKPRKNVCTIAQADPMLAVHERRHGDGATEFMSSFMSTPDLIRATEERWVDDGNQLDALHVPSRQLVELSFVPSNPFARTAERFTGRVPVCRAVQTRLLHGSSEDERWCHVLWKYARNHLLSLIGPEVGLDRKLVSCKSQDDKDNLPTGQPGRPISCDVRTKGRIIVPIIPGVTKQSAPMPRVAPAMDHQVGSVSSTTLSVSLEMDIPESCAESWVSGEATMVMHDPRFNLRARAGARPPV